MKKTFLFLLAVTFNTLLFAQHYTPTDNKSSVNFAIKNFGMLVNGTFTGLSGDILFNPAELGKATFNVSVEASSVNTGNSSRDSHLKKDDYFDVAKHPKISFVSTKVTTSNKAGILFIFGNLTIKGITRTVSFPFTATPVLDGMFFAGSCKLNRRDFGVGSNSLVLSDKLTLNLAVFAKKN